MTMNPELLDTAKEVIKHNHVSNAATATDAPAYSWNEE